MKLLEKLSSSKLKNKNEKDTDMLRKIRLSIPAQVASITPPLGPVLGQYGINVLEFCKQFNEASKYYDAEVMLRVEITLFRNKTFSFIIDGPALGFLIYEILVSKSYNDFLKSNPNNVSVYKDQISYITSLDFKMPSELSLEEFYELITFLSLKNDLNLISLAKNVRSTLSTMGIKINF